MGLSSEVVKHGFLDPNDPVAISFWIISISMVASTVFFLMESMAVSDHWKTSPILYRYIDWSITAPLQMVEFYLILSAVKPDIDRQMFLRLLLGTVAMLAFGYAGEAKFMNPFGAFFLGMCGWAFILYEVFSGEAGKVCADGITNKYVKESFATMRFIVSVGWSIYPLGYFFGYLQGAVDDDTLNLVYNLADFVNKIAFCLAIWASAKNSTLEKKEGALLG